MVDATPLRLGVAGLGRAFSVMLPTFARHPAVRLVAAADTRAEARARFAGPLIIELFDVEKKLRSLPRLRALMSAAPGARA